MATILIKKRDTTGAPSAGDLTNSAGGAELAVNTADKRLYAKDSGGNVVELGTAPSTVDINAGSIDGTPIGAASASTGAFTTLSSNSTTTLNGTTIPASKTLLVSTDIGTSVQAYDADTAKYDDTTANFTGTLQNGGSNVVVDTDIGSTVQAYDANTAKYDDTTANFTGTLQNGGSNVLVDTDIGTNVQAYDADTAKYDDVTANFTGTLQNGGSNVVVDTDIGSTVQAYDADTAKYDDTTANFTGTLQNGGSNVLVDTDIGTNVQAYDADTAKYDDVTANFTGTLQNGGSNVVVDSDIGSTVQAYDAQLADIAGLTPTDGNFIVGDGANFVAESGSTARTSLGLGTIATQAADNVNIDGGAVDGITLGTNSAVTEAQIDNININGNTIVSSDTDGDINITPNGTGDLILDGLKWPQADGTADYVLKTNGSGQLSWTEQTGGGGTPGGSDTQIQYNNAGSFAGASGLVTDGSNLTLNAQGDLRFADSDSSNWVAFQAPATIASNVTWTLPSADGTSGQVLSTDGSGALSWATASGGGGGGGTSVTVTQITATASQTDFSVTYTVGQLSVYLNGALLASADYTATNGTTVVLAAGAASGDIFTAVAYDSATQITVGDSKVEVTDTGSDGTATFTLDNTVRAKVNQYGIGLGTETPSSGMGIKFPADQTIIGASTDANTLDDYEEGTWTPADGSGAGLTFTGISDATYTKIGRIVIAKAGLDYPSTANTNDAKISGLPFTSGTTNGTQPTMGGTSIAFTTYANIIYMLIGSASTQFDIYGPAGTGNYGRIANNNLSAQTLRFIAVYQV